MKIITLDKIVGTPTTEHGNLGTYSIANIVSNSPGKRWISNCPHDQIRVNVSSSTSAFYLGNVKADSGEYKFLDTETTIHASTQITQADPAEITTAADHELVTGDQVYIEDVEGMVDINDQIHTITVTGTDTFTLDGVDSTGFVAHVAGTGSIRKVLNSGLLTFREVRNYTEFFQGVAAILKQTWKDLTYAVRSAYLIIDLYNTLDKKGTTLTTWTSGGSNTIGRFEDGSSNAIVLDDEIDVNLGSVVLFNSIGNSTIREISRDGVSDRLVVRTNTANSWLTDGDDVYLDTVLFSGSEVEISSKCFEVVNVDNGGPFTFELVGTEETFCTLTGLSGTDLGGVYKTHQISAIIGDGSSTTGVTITPDPASASLTIFKILYPATAGILKVGFAQTWSNPQVGVNDSRSSYSVREEIANGALSTRNRNIVQRIQGNLLLLAADFFSLKDFANDRDALPFACLVFDDLDTTSRHALYCIFQEPPTGTYASNKLRSVSINLREFI